MAPHSTLTLDETVWFALCVVDDHVVSTNIDDLAVVDGQHTGIHLRIDAVKLSHLQIDSTAFGALVWCTTSISIIAKLLKHATIGIELVGSRALRGLSLISTWVINPSYAYNAFRGVIVVANHSTALHRRSLVLLRLHHYEQKISFVYERFILCFLFDTLIIWIQISFF